MLNQKKTAIRHVIHSFQRKMHLLKRIPLQSLMNRRIPTVGLREALGG